MARRKTPKTVAELIDAFGGASKFAQLLDLNGSSTASEMKRSGSIRPRYWPKIIQEAAGAKPRIRGVSASTLMKMHSDDALAG